MRPIWFLFLFVFGFPCPHVLTADTSTQKSKVNSAANWQAGIGRRVVTPKTGVWLAGYGRKREAKGTIHDVWVKVLALQSRDGKRVVMATTDHMGMSKTIYESLC